MSNTLPKTKFELEFNHGSEYSEEEREAVLRVLASHAPSCGNEVLSFEKEFAEFTGTTYGIAVGNASQGLEIAVRAILASYPHKLNRDAELEVIVPAISWIATSSSAAIAGAKVIFADVINPTICIDPESVKRLVTNKTVAVIIVHLYGRPVDGLSELAQWLKERNIALIEDCAHAVGSVDASGLKCGNIGSVGVFSFHQQKNMVTLGEGGMCVTSDSRLRELMVGFRSMCAMSYDPKGKYLPLDAEKHPMGERYWLMDFADHGHNFRMTDMQASVGRVQLRKVLGWNARRTEIAHMLYNGLRDIHPGLVLPDVDQVSPSHVHAWHIFHVLVTDTFPVPKETFMFTMLHEFGIKTWNHYSPMHLATSFRSRGLGKVGDCPVAEALVEQFVSLPIHPRLANEAVNYMIESIKAISSRPFTPRPISNPILQALLSLYQSQSTSSTPDGTVSNSSMREVLLEGVVTDQLDEFERQVRVSAQDGLFTSASEVYVTRAPGRLDVMGGNDDYTGGLVLECTIAEATFTAAQARNDGNIVIRNRQLCDQDIAIPVSILKDDHISPSSLASYLKATFPESRWPLYVVGVLLWLQLRFPSQMFSERQGLSLMLWGKVPLNRGVSSSASVEVAAMKAAAQVFGIALSGEILATACQWTENQVCSSACGIMDQMAVTLGRPFMAMRCQPAVIVDAPVFPDDLTIFALDSGASHEVSGVEYEAARAAAFMGYKIICAMEGLEITEEKDCEIPRFKDSKYNGYLANMSPSVFARKYENALPVSMLGSEFTERYGLHVDPATPVLPDHEYHIRVNTKYAVLENNRVELFSTLLKGCSATNTSASHRHSVYQQLGELMYQSHDSYTECGLGSSATSRIVDLVRDLGPESGLYGAKITGGGAGTSKLV
jgi:galactokinase